jgi:hypothetical protein
MGVAWGEEKKLRRKTKIKEEMCEARLTRTVAPNLGMKMLSQESVRGLNDKQEEARLWQEAEALERSVNHKKNGETRPEISKQAY